MTTIADLNERIAIEAESRTPDASGGYNVSWQPVITLWAQVTPFSAHEKWQNGQLGPVSAYRITIRARSDITPAHRLIWKNATLNIRAVTVQPDRRFTDIIASSGEAV